jgi:hypothetical protein
VSLIDRIDAGTKRCARRKEGNDAFLVLFFDPLHTPVTAVLALHLLLFAAVRRLMTGRNAPAF